VFAVLKNEINSPAPIHSLILFEYKVSVSEEKRIVELEPINLCNKLLGILKKVVDLALTITSSLYVQKHMFLGWILHEHID
jgi:hypothetical protein